MIVEGNKIATEILAKLKNQIAAMARRPVLAVILVGNDPASINYVAKKRQAAEQIGLDCQIKNFPAEIDQATLTDEIKKIQEEINPDGLIIQLPLPEQLNQDEIVNLVDAKKDVDCLTKINLDKLTDAAASLIPPTPAAILTILDYYKIELAGKKIVLVGEGALVGAPLKTILTNRGLDVTTCRDVANSVELLKTADVIISGVGKPKIITESMIKPDAVVIDAGISFVADKVVGDVDFENVKDLTSLITPPVGGVGPVTVAKLLENVVKASINR